MHEEFILSGIEMRHDAAEFSTAVVCTLLPFQPFQDCEAIKYLSHRNHHRHDCHLINHVTAAEKNFLSDDRIAKQGREHLTQGSS